MTDWGCCLGFLVDYSKYKSECCSQSTKEYRVSHLKAKKEFGFPANSAPRSQNRLAVIFFLNNGRLGSVSLRRAKNAAGC